MSEHTKNQSGQEHVGPDLEHHEEIIHRLHHIDERLEQLEELLLDYAALNEEEYEEGEGEELEEGEECGDCGEEDEDEYEDEEEYEEGEGEELEEYSEDPHEEMLALLENIESRLDTIEDIAEEHIALDFDEDDFEEEEEEPSEENQK